MNYYDALANAQIGSAHPGGKALTKWILKRAGIKRTDAVLDLGCGIGDTSIYIYNTFGCKVFSVDSHPKMIEHLRKRTRNIHQITPILEAAESLSLSDNFFSIAISESVLVFTDIRKSLAELIRVLKPKSKLLLIEMTSEGRKNGNLDELKNFYKIGKVPTEQEWLSYLSEAGFMNISILKSSTVNEEISKVLITGNHNYQMPIHDLATESFLINQSILLAKYGNEVGFRVIEAYKPN